MSMGMDVFLANSSDSMTFSDFEFKQDLEQFLPYSEFLPDSLELSDSHECKFISSNSNQSLWDFNGDDGPAMINPNAVLPLMTSTSTNIGRSPSPSVRESHLTFSPGIFKIAPTKVQTEATVTIKKNLSSSLTSITSTERKHLQPITPIVKSVTKVTPILAKPITIQRPIVIKNAAFRQTTTTQIVSCSGSPVSIRTMPATSVVAHSATIQQKNAKNQETVNSFRIYPKPAYSYSCLIAMALKNSKNGSLPVSEIYNFMCRHFPYFKTAPSGWKNSVRHNLSLNKCFEKIEKPALNGAQRKGCLWAMNPAKISKMDEEVQKWSKKDPMAIKKAMVNPENLDALERGELKFSCPYDDNETEIFGDSCGSADSGEGTDSELDSQEEMESEETEIEMKEMQIQYIHLKSEPQEDDYDEIEVKEEVIVDDWEDDKEQLRTEVALAKKELEFDLTTNKRRRTYLMQTF